MSALNQKITYKLTAEEIEAYKLLAEYRHNFKLIGNLFRERKDMREEVHQLVKVIDEHLKKNLFDSLVYKTCFIIQKNLTI